MSDRPAVQATGLRKSYGIVEAVASVDLLVDPGTVLGFLGPNGAGKTTVIRMLSTVLSPDAGTFTVAGVPHTNPLEVRRRVGVLPESAGYPAGQTGHEWLAYHGRLFGRSRQDAWARARALLDEVGLGERAGTLVSGYSRGMRQRLGIARALVNDPAVIFLDEPTLGLDPGGQQQVLDLVGRMARQSGVAVVLSTHLLAEVEQSCDRVVILNRGRVVAAGTVADVARRAAAPRRASLRVPPALAARAVAVIETDDLSVDVVDRTGGEIGVTMPFGVDPQDTSSYVLRRCLDAEVPVLGFVLEGGRLSDAFLAVTRARG